MTRVYTACRFPLREATVDDVQWIFDNFAYQSRNPFEALTEGATLRECMENYLERNKQRIVIDEGAGNPSTKTLAGININKGEIGPPRGLNRKIGDRVRDTAFRNVDRCVVGIMEQWDNTVSVLRHWFPWIPASTDTREHVSFVGEDKESVDELSPDVVKVIQANNEADMELYEYGLQIMEQQLWDMEHGHL